MNATGAVQAKQAVKLAQTVVSTEEIHGGNTITRNSGVQDLAPRRTGYGLPCSKCGTYYAADRSSCPNCQCSERVSPTGIPAPKVVVTADLPEDRELEEERERFLKEFKSQLYTAHAQIDPGEVFLCSVEGHHDEDSEPAPVCKTCYSRLQEKADHLEGALHMDVKEAAQIVYDAVWSDSSDPSKTYQNAAQALLAELRRRAGLSMVLSTHNPYAH